jgi:hypothetical protein
MKYKTFDKCVVAPKGKILKRGPTESELRDALEIMLHWATQGDKSHNPYCQPAVRHALRVLGAAKGLTCDYLDVPVIDLPITEYRKA